MRFELIHEGLLASLFYFFNFLFLWIYIIHNFLYLYCCFFHVNAFSFVFLIPSHFRSFHEASLSAIILSVLFSFFFAPAHFTILMRCFNFAHFLRFSSINPSVYLCYSLYFYYKLSCRSLSLWLILFFPPESRLRLLLRSTPQTRRILDMTLSCLKIICIRYEYLI